MTTKRKKKKNQAEQPDQAPGTETETQQQSEPVEAALDSDKQQLPDEQVADAVAEEVDWKDKYLRSKAELANYRKRTQEEQSQLLRYANSNLVKSLLEVMDDFERTLEAAVTDESSKQMLDGVQLVYDKLSKILKDHHVESIEALGESFDPNCHEAMMQQPSDEPPGTILQVVQKGYRMHDRVLRAARVILAKAAETAEQAPPEVEAEG